MLESLRTVAIIESSESSNRLEGIVAPKHRIEALVRQNTMPANRSENEIAGYRDALNLIHDSAPHMEFSANVIKQLHDLLYRHLPGLGGNWKTTQNRIEERGPDGSLIRIRFTPVEPVAVPQAIDDLEALYHKALGSGGNPLLLIPLVVLDFLCIHPFTDGNGRTARLITTLLLYHGGYEVGRYISLERIFEESRESYYDTLEASSAHWHQGRHDVMPWVDYFWGVLIKAYKELEDRVGTFDQGSKQARIEAAIERSTKPISISELERICPDVSRDWIRIVLRRLRDEGKIERRGKGRGAKWVKVG